MKENQHIITRYWQSSDVLENDNDNEINVSKVIYN